MSGGIFISYRRDDAKHAAGRLVDRLGQTFAKDQLFLDIDNIEPGLDFVKVLSEQVQACDVLQAVIGPGWLDSRDAGGSRRLDNARDFVRIEIEAALARDIRVIPVLVDGAQMPGEQDLPPSLKPLRVRNAVRLFHERFSSDAEDLTRALAKVVAPKKGWFGGGFGAAKPTAQTHQSEPELNKTVRGAQLAATSLKRSEPAVQNEPIAQALLFLVGTVAGLFLLVAPVAKELSNSNQQLSFLLVFGYLTLVIAAALVFVGRRGAVCSRIEKWIYATVILLAAFFLIVRVLLALGISL